MNRADRLQYGSGAAYRACGMELISRNAVVAANKFNPSILTQMWLIRNEIVAEDEFENWCVFSNAAVQINAHRCPNPTYERGAERVGITRDKSTCPCHPKLIAHLAFLFSPFTTRPGFGMIPRILYPV